MSAGHLARLAVAVAALFECACAPMILYMHAKKDPALVIDVDESTTRSGATQKQLVVTPRPLDFTAAQPPVAPPPGGPPPNTAALHFQCITQERAEHEHLVRVVSEYDKREKLGLATLAVFDFVPAIVFASHRTNDDPGARAANYAIGGLFVLDAAVLFGLVAFAPHTVSEVATDQPGQWQDVGYRCDSGLSVHAGSVTTIVDAKGALAPEAEAQLVRELVTSPASLTLERAGTSKAADVDEAVRCRWAEGRGYPFGDRCRMLQPRMPVPVIFPLPASAAAAP